MGGAIVARDAVTDRPEAHERRVGIRWYIAAKYASSVA
jgi:hypothetical protein